MKTLKQIENGFKNEIRILRNKFDNIYLTGTQYQSIQYAIERIQLSFLGKELIPIFETNELERHYNELQKRIKLLTLTDDEYTAIDTQIEIVAKYLKEV